MESRARIGAGLLLAAFAAQAVAGMLPLSATWDEITHLPSGYTYLKTGEVALNRQHPPLVKLLCALPLLALHPRADFLDPNRLEAPGYEWVYGTDFLYRNDADRLLFWGRLPVVGLGTLLGLYVFLWSGRLFGPAGGLLSLALYAFCPSFLAHTHLVTMDVGLACFATMAFYHLWRDTPGHALAAGAALGAALATKFSAVAFLAVVPVLALARRPRSPKRLAAVLAVAVAVVYLAYLLPSDPRFYFQGMTALHRDHQPGFQHYLLGAFRERFWSYFAVALAVKTPLPTLMALVAAAALAIRAHKPARDEAFVLLPAAVFFAVTTAFADDLGVRYVLPVLALLLVFAGRLGPWLLERRQRAGIALVLLGWLVWGTLRISPDHLAYFNALAGGPENGWKVLDDSNIDWGQDLKRLRPWMESHGVDEVALLYTGNASPEYHGIRYRRLDRDEFGAPRPGWYAVSVQALIRGRHWERTRGSHTDWMARYRPVGRVGYSIYLFKFPAGTSAPL